MSRWPGHSEILIDGSKRAGECLGWKSVTIVNYKITPQVICRTDCQIQGQKVLNQNGCTKGKAGVQMGVQINFEKLQTQYSLALRGIVQ